MDKIRSPNRRNNSITNIDSDIHSNIYSDHYPIKATIIINLKAKHEQENVQYESDECEPHQQKEYNATLKSLSNTITWDKDPHKTISLALKEATNKSIPKRHKFIKKETNHSRNNIYYNKKRRSNKDDKEAEVQELTTVLTKQMRTGRRKRLLDMVTTTLDIRDRWMGLRCLKKGYTPIPYTFKEDDGTRFKVGNKAAEAENILASKILGKLTQTTNHKHHNPQRNKS